MLNVTKVNSQIRSSDVLFWEREKDVDIVVNGYWGIKANLKQEKYRKILGLLVEKFGIIPENNQMYRYKKKPWIKEKALTKVYNDFSELMKVPEMQVEDTRLVRIIRYNVKNARVFKGTEYVYVNTEFTDMINENENIKYYNKKKLCPLYACLDNEFLMMMPIRMQDDNNYLKEIEKEPIADQNE